MNNSTFITWFISHQSDNDSVEIDAYDSTHDVRAIDRWDYLMSVVDATPLEDPNNSLFETSQSEASTMVAVHHPVCVPHQGGACDDQANLLAMTSLRQQNRRAWICLVHHTCSELSTAHALDQPVDAAMPGLGTKRRYKGVANANHLVDDNWRKGFALFLLSAYGAAAKMAYRHLLDSGVDAIQRRTLEVLGRPLTAQLVSEILSDGGYGIDQVTVTMWFPDYRQALRAWQSDWEPSVDPTLVEQRLGGPIQLPFLEL
jgi:hypothetical protein